MYNFIIYNVDKLIYKIKTKCQLISLSANQIKKPSPAETQKMPKLNYQYTKVYVDLRACYIMLSDLNLHQSEQSIDVNGTLQVKNPSHFMKLLLVDNRKIVVLT